MPESVRKILELGGLAAYLNSQLEEQAAASVRMPVVDR
jgi:hypothetical protein